MTEVSCREFWNKATVPEASSDRVCVSSPDWGTKPLCDKRSTYASVEEVKPGDCPEIVFSRPSLTVFKARKAEC